jgi:hypothetical protein
MAGPGRLFNGPCKNDETFLLGIANELTQLAGVPLSEVQYYQLHQYVNYDPLYQEASPGEQFRGPYQLAVTITFDESEGNYDQDVNDEGVERSFDAKLGIAKLEWDSKVVGFLPPGTPGFVEPREGDVIGVFESPNTRWFDIKKVDRSGYVQMTSTFVAWKIELKKRNSFTPDRRL